MWNTRARTGFREQQLQTHTHESLGSERLAKQERGRDKQNSEDLDCLRFDPQRFRFRFQLMKNLRQGFYLFFGVSEMSGRDCQLIWFVMTSYANDNDASRQLILVHPSFLTRGFLGPHTGHRQLNSLCRSTVTGPSLPNFTYPVRCILSAFNSFLTRAPYENRQTAFGKLRARK